MRTYLNLSGESNVAAYDCGSDYIRVRFSDGSTYLYTYVSAGEANVDRAKRLAVAGVGLNGHINANMRDRYAGKASGDARS